MIILKDVVLKKDFSDPKVSMHFENHGRIG